MGSKDRSANVPSVCTGKLYSYGYMHMDFLINAGMNTPGADIYTRLSQL
jgi:hypothetical protein